MARQAKKTKAKKAKKHAAKSSRKPSEAVKRKRIISAMLDQAASKDWCAVTLNTISDATGLSISDVCGIFPTKQDILYAFLDEIDQRVLDGSASGSVDESPRDRLFDVLMRRFDLLLSHKEAIVNILRDMPKDPLTGLCGIPRFGNSMTNMLEAAQLSSSGCSGFLKTKGLGLVYLNSVRVWLKDDTPDMSKTMAALDKSLRRADSVATAIFKR